MGIFTAGYILNVVFTAIAFFTFIKLLSSNVYLNYHRILPSIGAIIMIHDFYVIVGPWIPVAGAEDIFKLLCDMCSLVIIFVMFSYLLLLKKPMFYLQVHVITVTAMVILCAVKLYNFIAESDIASITPELVGLVIVTVGSIYTAISADDKRLFAREDNKPAYMMLSAFIIALCGYLLQLIFRQCSFIASAAYAVNCVIYYYMALTNRIEDLEVSMSNEIFNTVSYPVAIVNPHYYICAINDAARVAFPNGKNLEFAFEGEDFRNKFVLGQSMVENNENDKEYYANGKWYLLKWSAAYDKKGVKGYIFTCTDVSDQHNEILVAREQTEEKSQFLAHMSHELRSPIHAIIGVSDILLSKHDITTKNRTLIQHIKKASDGLLDLVDSILDFSKLEAGKFTFAEKKYCIEELFEELAYSNIVNLQSKPVDFSFAVTTEYPKYLYGDAVRVREIFQNLLSNAVKFTDTGSIHAEVSFETVGDRVHIKFLVADTGIGMTPDQISEIFTEYVSKAGSMEGTGLGLSITKQLVELLGGSITAKSNGLSGSTFEGDFYQKVTETEMLEETVFNRRTVMNVGNSSSVSTIRAEWVYPNAHVLVVDDMKINQEILTQLLSPWRVHVTAVSDGLQAINAAKETSFDLILLDQMMAPISGTETADSLRRFTDTPIVLVTANTEDNVKGLLEEHNINDFMGKPIHIQDVARVVEQYIPVKLREKNLDETVATSAVRRGNSSLNVYRKTLETFVKEMQPLLLNLPNYVVDNRNLFKIKVHGIKGVSRQIGRDAFSDQAEIMEMAAKAEHWSYIEKHLDEFLTALCDVVEEATVELTQMSPSESLAVELAEEFSDDKKNDPEEIIHTFQSLLQAFENFDIFEIEQHIASLGTMILNEEQNAVYSKAIDAYDELEYEAGSRVLSQYLNK